MAKLRNRPLRGAVALRAVGSEQPELMIFGLVARGTIEQPFLRLELRVLKVRVSALFPEPPLQLFGLRNVGVGDCGIVFKAIETNPSERGVIHFRVPRDAALMLDVAGRAGAYLGVKCGWLPLQYPLAVRVANDAVLRFNAL